MEKLLKISSLFFCFIQLFSCQNNPSRNLSTVANRKDSATISFKLKKNERCLFNYCDIFFTHTELLFSNPGNNDSVFSKTISIEIPTSINYGFAATGVSNVATFTEYFYLILPGDSITFFLDSGRYLRADTLHSNRILNNPSATYNPSFDNLLKKFKTPHSNAEWLQNFRTYYSGLLQHQVLENNRIKKSIVNADSDSNYLKLHAEILFYKNLFDYIFKEKKFSSIIAEQYTPFLSATKDIINSPTPILSQNLLALFYGSLQVSLINKKQDFNNYELMYSEALASKIGFFKPGLLTSFLDVVPKNTATYKRIAADIKKRYQGTKYEQHVADLEAEDLKISSIISRDSLVKIDKQITTWDYLINSKRDTFIFVDFWASWCAPCRAQLPLMDSLKIFFKNDPIEFISVNIDKEKNDWLLSSKAENKYLQRNNYHLILYSKLGLLKRWSINSIPRYMIFKNGQALVTDFIPPTDADFKRELKKIVADNK